MTTTTPSIDLSEVLRLHALWRQDAFCGCRANLSGADLSGADLSGADLSGANLFGADLSGADLSDAKLSGANLFGADLSGADLSHANLFSADLSHAKLSHANLSRANLSRADLSGAIDLPIASDAPARLLAVAQAALASPKALEMKTWHTCSTTHCISGCAEHLGGSIATLLYQQMGPDVAGLMLLGVEAHSYFYASNAKALAFLQSVVDNADVA